MKGGNRYKTFFCTVVSVVHTHTQLPECVDNGCVGSGNPKEYHFNQNSLGLSPPLSPALNRRFPLFREGIRKYRLLGFGTPPETQRA